MTELHASNDLLKLIDIHKFHEFQPKQCYLCGIEQFRQNNTPTLRWSRAAKTFFKPPMPIAIMALSILVLVIALAFTI